MAIPLTIREYMTLGLLHFRHITMYSSTVAIFVDAGFFTRKFTKIADPQMTATPKTLAKAM